jgi:hypothetical protein
MANSLGGRRFSGVQRVQAREFVTAVRESGEEEDDDDFHCEHCHAFAGTYEAVDVHEQLCAANPARATAGPAEETRGAAATQPEAAADEFDGLAPQEEASGVGVGLGRIVTLYCHSPTSYHMH